MDDDNDWGNEDDDSIFYQIQESDFYSQNECGSSWTLVDSKNDLPMSSEGEVLDPVTAHLHNTSELRDKVEMLERKLEETVKLNSELKEKNYSLQGEAGTLRRRLQQHNSNKQQQIFDKIQSIQDVKQKETEERKKLQNQIESLKSQLNVSRVEVTTLEESNQQLKRRESLKKTASNPTIGTTLTGATAFGISSQAQCSQTAQKSHYFPNTSRYDKYSALNRTSFYASEVFSQAKAASPKVETESKEIQTDALLVPDPILEPSPQASSACDEDEDELEDPAKFLYSANAYDEIKISVRRLIRVEIQMLKPMIEKTLRQFPSEFRRRLSPRKTRFGLGFEAFDATSLMLQWLSEQEVDQYQDKDMQSQYFKRMEEIYDSSKRYTLQYPPLSAEVENNSENWADSEQIMDTGSDDDYVDASEQQPLTAGSQHEHSRDSDTSEDEYDIEAQLVPTQVAPAVAEFDVIAAGTQHTQMTQTVELVSNKTDRKPLTFFKEYKLKSRLLTNRNCYKYIKDGQPLEIVSEILDGLYQEGPGIWNALYFVKNELRFIIEGRDLFKPNRFQVFMTLLVWAKNLWSVVSTVESDERPKLPRDWDTELFGWTELIILVVWRPSRSLIAFCRELRSIFLQIILHIIQSGYFESEKENYRRLFLTIQDCIKNPTHHSLLNAQLVLDILNSLQRTHIVPFFCKVSIAAFEIVLPNCFLLELSNRINDEFQANPCILLFDRYLDLMDRLGTCPTESNLIPKKTRKKRKLSDDSLDMALNSMDSSMAATLPQSPLNIFKEREIKKCPCHVAAVTNLLLMLMKTFELWKEKYRDAEFESLLKQNIGKRLNAKNIYTDILVRAFEFIYTLYKHSDNLGNSFSADVSTYFWSVVGWYRRFRKYFPLRPDMDAMLLHMTSDAEDRRKAGDGRITFPPSFDAEWLKLVNQFPVLNIGGRIDLD